MPALTYKCKLVNLSYADMVFTLYPTFEYYQHKGLRNCLEKIEMECCEYDFIIKFLPGETPRIENYHFVNSLYQIQFTHPEYDRYIRRKDPDHLLYHKDNFKISDSHYHIKFKSILSREQIIFILDTCVKHQLIEETEKQQFLEALSDRYARMKEDITHLLVANQLIDLKNLLNYISKCEDNDILSNLHEYLLTKDFDYLRLKSTSATKSWQGTNHEGQIVETSEVWARLEKAITLQMIHNIRIRCNPFISQIGSEYANNLASNHRFFSIKRKSTSVKSTNDAYAAFCDADAEKLDKKYKSNFSFTM